MFICLSYILYSVYIFDVYIVALCSAILNLNIFVIATYYEICFSHIFRIMSSIYTYIYIFLIRKIKRVLYRTFLYR